VRGGASICESAGMRGLPRRVGLGGSAGPRTSRLVSGITATAGGLGLHLGRGRRGVGISSLPGPSTPLSQMGVRRAQERLFWSCTPKQLLEQAAGVEAKSRIDLGRIYLAMKEEVLMQRAGRDERGALWTWGKWAAVYIKRSRRDINRCIEAFGTSRPNSQSEDVIQFQKNTA
jgi:hypothetical protein